jgi:serine/threonine protein kinase
MLAPLKSPPSNLPPSNAPALKVPAVNVPASVAAPEQHPVEHAGHVVGGRYRLDARIARGAMGSIWRAQHLELRCPVAIKFLDITVGGEGELHGRFLQEARSTAAVRCAHVVQVFDYGTDGNIPFIVMELLEGETLEQRLNRRGVLSPVELDEIFRDVVSGVSRSHATSVIHRDLKPSNIFIAKEGSDEVTKLIDFGIAKVDEARLGFTPRAGTRAGTVIGTPDYMSPEQLRAGAEIDHSVDLWALAIVAFECLTGRPPFASKSLTDLVVQICTETPVLPSTLASVPAGFDRWFRKATHRDPASRFSSAEEMAAALSPILQGARTVPLPQQAPSREPSGGTRRLGSVWLGASFSNLRRAVVRWSWAAKLGKETRVWLSPARLGLALGLLVGVGMVLAFRAAPSAPPAASAVPERPAAAVVEPPVAPDTPPPDTRAPPALAVDAPALPERDVSSTVGVSAASNEQPAPAISPAPIKAVEPGPLPPAPRPAPQRSATLPPNGAVADELPKPLRERPSAAPTLSRASRALPSRALPSRPAVEENISPPVPVPDGEALFAERL